MRKYINGDIIANEIRMIRRRTINCCYLIVEGESDFKLFKKFAKDKNCEVKFVDGKENVINAINSLNKTKTPGVLGIVDSDFEKVLNPELERVNIVTTDTHDIETLIIKSQTLEDFLMEYTNKNKIETFIRLKEDNFRNIILNLGIIIGKLRFISIKEDLNLKFKEIDFSKFIDVNLFEINGDNLIKEVIINTINCRITFEEIKVKLTNLKIDSQDLWQMCCGHDLTELISICYNKILKGYRNNALNSDEVEKILRLSYQYRYFINTKLYISIKEWELKNIPYSILFNYNETEALTS